MLSLALPGRVFVCVTATDMRKSFDGLSAVVRDHLKQDPLAGDLFVFRNRRGDRLKLLYWDEDGLAVWAKKQAAVCPPTYPFTEATQRGDNLARWLIGASRMD